MPVLHTRAGLVNADERWLIEHAGLDDDLRDSWEHEIHDEERGALLDLLFGAAAKGIRVCVLSGDVHVSAVFSIEDGEGRRIYQLTSSAITYGLSRAVSWVLSQGAADEGETAEGHRFQRLALYADSSYALISVDPGTGESWFKLYGKQTLDPPPSLDRDKTVPLTPLGGQDPAVLNRRCRRRNRVDPDHSTDESLGASAPGRSGRSLGSSLPLLRDHGPLDRFCVVEPAYLPSPPQGQGRRIGISSWTSSIEAPGRT